MIKGKANIKITIQGLIEWGQNLSANKDNRIRTVHELDQCYLTAIRTYFTRWLTRTNSYDFISTI